MNDSGLIIFSRLDLQVTSKVLKIGKKIISYV